MSRKHDRTLAAAFAEPTRAKYSLEFGARVSPQRWDRAVMHYKGYTGLLEIDEETGILFGRVIGLRDVITFQGETVPEAREAFKESVDDYLRFCQEQGQPPEKPFSGKFILRIKPSLHRELAHIAESRKKSLNSLIEEILAGAAQRTGERTDNSAKLSTTKAKKPKRSKASARRSDSDEVKLKYKRWFD